MTFELYSKFPRKIWLVILFIAVILIIYFVLRFVGINAKNTPDEFLQARQQASLIAADIVAISNNSSSNFNQLAELDSQGRYTEALNLVSQQLENNNASRAKAVSLSKELETMAKSLSEISPASASQTALEAIASETQLISGLITYNDYLNQLLSALQNKFLGKSPIVNIQDLINKINNQAQIINSLNQKFNDAMAQFDSK